MSQKQQQPSLHVHIKGQAAPVRAARTTAPGKRKKKAPAAGKPPAKNGGISIRGNGALFVNCRSAVVNNQQL